MSDINSSQNSVFLDVCPLPLPRGGLELESSFSILDDPSAKNMLQLFSSKTQDFFHDSMPSFGSWVSSTDAFDVFHDSLQEPCDHETKAEHQVLDATLSFSVPEVSMTDLTVGALLGAGGFAAVFEVTSFEPLSNSSKNCNYALKRLHDALLEEDDDYEIKAAANDLLIEATIMSKLPNHTNVIRCHAVSASFWENPARGFLILDKLADTLANRIQRWRILPESTSKQGARVRNIAPGIASALQFLHSHNVIYRDLKPQNIGFDAEGNVQIFDLDWPARTTQIINAS